MAHWRFPLVWLPVVAAIAALAGCGGGGEGEATPTPDVQATETAAAAGEAAATATAAAQSTEATATAEALSVDATATAEALAPVATATAEALSVAATATAEAAELAGAGLSRDSPVPAGQSYVVPEGWEVMVVDFIPDATEAVLQENPNNDPPAPGKKFAIVTLRGTNISAEGPAPGDPADFDPTFVFRLVGSLNVQYSTFENDCGVYPGSFVFRNTVAFPEGTVEGNICFEVGETETDFVLFTEFMESWGDVNKRWFAAQ